ncbi:MAG: N-acetylmuramoyl-L-alanine amidase [Bacteroides sp.]|nr:N-acetylmuramoyl-L-alanine amidase [Bacteroides sp.]
MRQINKIIIHCTATPEGRDVTVDQVRDLHVRVNRWADIGYHFLIYLDGSIHTGRPLDKVGAHCAGHNTGSIGICYVGGLAPDGKTPKDTRTPAQRVALRQLVQNLRRQFPGATVHGHNEFAAKACPSFNVKTDL